MNSRWLIRRDVRNPSQRSGFGWLRIDHRTRRALVLHTSTASLARLRCLSLLLLSANVGYPGDPELIELRLSSGTIGQLRFNPGSYIMHRSEVDQTESGPKRNVTPPVLPRHPLNNLDVAAEVETKQISTRRSNDWLR